MIAITATHDLSHFNSTQRAIIKKGLAKGWKISVPYLGTPHAFIDRGDGRLLHIFSASPPTMSYPVAHLANDKFATHCLLRDDNFPLQPTLLLEEGQLPEEAAAFLEKHSPVVVKPVDAAHGRGITVNIVSLDALRSAIEIARVNGQATRAILVQAQYVEPIDIRLTCIDYRYRAALIRVPARVLGDGVHTVEQLILQENQNGKRGEPYKASLAVIDLERSKTYLSDKAALVPRKDEYVQVLGTANYGTGGELIDVSDDIPGWLAEMSETIAKKLEMPVAGIDYMVRSQPKKELSATDLCPSITEVNKCPALFMHDQPTVGRNRRVIDAYINYLAGL